VQIGDVGQLSKEDQGLVPQALQLLKCDPCRSFRIDIEADSMVQIDEETDKQSRLEFLGAVSGFLKEIANGASANPKLAPLMVSMLGFGVRGFKIGKALEGEIDTAMDQFKADAQQPAPPSPEMMKIQAEGQQHQAELAQNAQFKQQEAQIEVWKAQQIQEAQARDSAQQQQLEAQREAQKQQYEQQMEMLRMANDKRMGEMETQIKVLVALIQSRTALEVAQINHAATETPEQVAAADQGTQLQGVLQALADSRRSFADSFAQATAPRSKRVVRDGTGRIAQVIEEPLQ